MKNWIFLLICALLLNVACARAEDSFYTNHEDCYYHLDSACNAPPSPTFVDSNRVYYPREAYDMVEISSEAAAAFEKSPCPLCVSHIEPLYLGEHMPAWTLDASPLGLGDLDDAAKARLKESRSADFISESAATSQAVDAYFEEYYDPQTDSIRMHNDYPAWYAGRWRNNAGCLSCAVVSPTQQVLAEFRTLFGNGAWIVPAKYSMDQLRRAQDEIFSELSAWCALHSDMDVQPVSASVESPAQVVVIGIYGSDWESAAAAMDKIAPLYVHFYRADALNTLA